MMTISTPEACTASNRSRSSRSLSWPTRHAVDSRAGDGAAWAGRAAVGHGENPPGRGRPDGLDLGQECLRDRRHAVGLDRFGVQHLPDYRLRQAHEARPFEPVVGQVEDPASRRPPRETGQRHGDDDGVRLPAGPGQGGGDCPLQQQRRQPPDAGPGHSRQRGHPEPQNRIGYPFQPGCPVRAAGIRARPANGPPFSASRGWADPPTARGGTWPVTPQCVCRFRRRRPSWCRRSRRSAQGCSCLAPGP